MTEPTKPEPRCYFFGCWNSPGHYMHGPCDSRERHLLEYCDNAHAIHLDGNLATRSGRGVRLQWGAQFRERDQRRATNDGAEYPQGHFLRHDLETGFTAIQWWDRCQGDTRGACNSTILLEGVHTTAEMLSALETNFPHVLANLEKYGVHLVEIFKEGNRPPVRWYTQAEVDAMSEKMDALLAENKYGG